MKTKTPYNIHIGGEVFPAFQPYGRATMEIFISGCHRSCKHCQNPELKDFNYGKDIPVDRYIKEYLKPRRDFFEIISISGGDLLCHDKKVAEKWVKSVYNIFTDKDFWLFTGEEDMKKVPKWAKEIFSVIKMGEYNPDLKSDKELASSNQRFCYRGKDY